MTDVDDLLLSTAFWVDEPDIFEIPLLNLDGHVADDLSADAVGSSQANHQDPGGSTRQRRRGGRPTLSEEEKARKEREKNRQAQSRYRQRQKEKRGDIEAQYNATITELQRSRLEHASQKHLNTILESVFAVRAATIEVLEKAKAAQEEQKAFLAKALTHNRDRPQLANGVTDSITGVPSISEAAVTAAAASKVPQGASPTMIRVDLGCGAEEGGKAHLDVDPELVEEIKRCSPEEFLRTWRQHVLTVRNAMAEYDVTSNDEVLTRLKLLMKEWAVYKALVLQYNRPCLYHMMASAGLPGVSEEQQREAYDAVVEKLNVSPVQRAKQAALWETYCLEVQRLREERAQAVEQISQTASWDPLTSDGLGRMTSQYIKALDGAAALNNYPEAEFRAFMELLNRSGQVLTPLQKARCAALTYPNFPDMLRLMHAVNRLPEAPS